MIVQHCFFWQFSMSLHHQTHFYIFIFRKMKNMLFLLTCLVLIFNVVGGNDAVSIKSLCPPEIHTAIFHFSHLQLWRVWRFWEFKGRQEGSTKRVAIFNWKREDLCSFWIIANRSSYSSCIYTEMVTLHSELDKTSSFSIRVDGMTWKEDRILTLCWL